MSHDRRFPYYALDDDGRLSSETPCSACGYNLRGLSPDGVCPECGTAIKQSLLGDFLYFSDPFWLRRIVRGMDILHIGLAGFFAVACGTLALFASSHLRSSTALGTIGLVFVVPLAGLWRATLAESAAVEDRRPFTLRRAVRFSIVSCAAWLLLGMLFALGSGPVSWEGYALIGAALMLLLLSSYLLYLRSLARRTYDRELSTSFTGVIGGWGVTCVGALVLTACYFYQVPRSVLVRTLVGAATCLGPFSLLMLIAMTPALLLPFRERLARIADMAADTRRKAEAGWTPM